MADWHEKHRGELDAAAEADEDEVVDLTVAEGLSVTMSFRLPAAEAETIRQAAADAGTSLSEWIRAACATTVHGRVIRPRNAALDEAINSLAHDLDQLRHAAHAA